MTLCTSPSSSGFSSGNSIYTAAANNGCSLATAAEMQGKVLAEYIWLGGSGSDMRSKTKVLDNKPNSPDDCPVLVVDGSLSNQSEEECCEVYLKPRKLFRDPFRGGDHILVLCDTFQPPQVNAENPSFSSAVPTLQPHESNRRVACENVMKRAGHSKPVFGGEQEYAVIHPSYPTVVPLSPYGSPFAPSSPINIPGVGHSCGAKEQTSHLQPGVDLSAAAARNLAESHLRCCLYAGVKVSGCHPGSMPGLWAYKVGPLQGVDFGDELWTSRYIMLRVAEQHGLGISFDSRSVNSDYGGPCCCVKYSTDETRQPGKGLFAMQEQLLRLQSAHPLQAYAYSEGRVERLLAKPMANFTYGVGNKKASVMIPSMAMLQGCGYYVDRRPASDMEPYRVSMLLVSASLDVPLPVALPQTPHFSTSSLSQHSAYNSLEECSGCSSECSSDDDSESMNTEDVLLDELDKMDGFALDTPAVSGSVNSECQSCDQCCTSPDTSASPLSCAVREQVMYENSTCAF